MIGPIGASRSNEREVFGTGSLLGAREDQRSTEAITILPGASPLYRTEALLARTPPLHILTLAAADLGEAADAMGEALG